MIYKYVFRPVLNVTWIWLLLYLTCPITNNWHVYTINKQNLISFYSNLKLTYAGRKNGLLRDHLLYDYYLYVQ